MATTTNYGWTTPDDTALVKDGAAAIRSLGSSIDTSLNTALGTRKAGLVLLNTTSFSAVASQSINDVFSATYDNYKIVISGVASANQDFGFRLRVGGADNSTASSYVYQYVQGNSTTISGIRSTGNIWYVGVIGNSLKSQLELTLVSPFEVDTTNFYCSASSAESSAFLRLSGGTHNQSTSYTGFTLSASTGTITGKVSVYGFNK